MQANGTIGRVQRAHLDPSAFDNDPLFLAVLTPDRLLLFDFADLAEDPKFRMIDRKYLVAEAASLRRIKAMFDKMAADGTDISVDISGYNSWDLEGDDSNEGLSFDVAAAMG